MHCNAYPERGTSNRRVPSWYASAARHVVFFVVAGASSCLARRPLARRRQEVASRRMEQTVLQLEVLDSEWDRLWAAAVCRRTGATAFPRAQPARPSRPKRRQLLQRDAPSVAAGAPTQWRALTRLQQPERRAVACRGEKGGAEPDATGNGQRTGPRRGSPRRARGRLRAARLRSARRW